MRVISGKNLAMKTIFKICFPLILLSTSMHSQNWLWSKPMGIQTKNPITGNVKSGVSGNLVTFLAEANSSYLVFTNLIGDTLWKKYFYNLVIKDAFLDAADNIYFAGIFTGTTTISNNTFVSQGGTDAIIGLFNSSGVLIKSKAFGTVSSEYANSLVLHNNEIIVTGAFIKPLMVNSILLNGNSKTFNTYVLKFDLNFNALSGIETISQGCDGIKVAVDQFNSIYLLGNSQYTLSLGTQSVYIAEDGQYLAKLSNNLSITWLKTINNHYSGGYYRPFIYFDSTANVVLGRVTGGGGGNLHEIAIEKYNRNGTIMWFKVVQVNDGGFIDTDNQDNIWVAGRLIDFNASASFSIAKVNSSGLITQVIYDNNVKHSIDGLAVKANNDFYIIGHCDASSVLNDYKCSPSGSIFMARYGMVMGIKDQKILANTFSIYPNPATGMITISCISGIKNNCTLSVKNALGQVVYLNSIKEMQGAFTREIDLSSHPKGIYFVEITSGNEKATEKVVLQ